MLSGLINLKRKFVAVEEQDENASCTNNSEPCRPRKRLRVAEPVSLHERTPHFTQNTCAGDGQVCGETREDQQKELRKDELIAKIKELQEVYLRVKKELERDVATINELSEETLTCMICRNRIRNPQILQCGHTACYGCLRFWWIQRLPEEGWVDDIDTTDESDTEDENDQLIEGDPAAPRGRFKFPSVVHRKKLCPYCNEELKCHPIPDLLIRAAVGEFTPDLHPTPAHIQARRQARLTRRQDIWRGIFAPLIPPAPPKNRYYPPAIPAHPPPPHPDPIIHNIAQGQYWRAVEEDRAKERKDAFETGRVLGATRVRMRRVAEAQQAAALLAAQQPGPDPLDAPGVPAV